MRSRTPPAAPPVLTGPGESVGLPGGWTLTLEDLCNGHGEWRATAYPPGGGAPRYAALGGSRRAAYEDARDWLAGHLNPPPWKCRAGGSDRMPSRGLGARDPLPEEVAPAAVENPTEDAS